MGLRVRVGVGLVLLEERGVLVVGAPLGCFAFLMSVVGVVSVRQWRVWLVHMDHLGLIGFLAPKNVWLTQLVCVGLLVCLWLPRGGG